MRYSFKNMAAVAAGLFAGMRPRPGFNPAEIIRRAQQRVNRYYGVGTSRYMPHQGARERERRRLGGFYNRARVQV